MRFELENPEYAAEERWNRHLKRTFATRPRGRSTELGLVDWGEIGTRPLILTIHWSVAQGEAESRWKKAIFR